MEIIETTFYDGRTGRVIFHSFIKKPKRVELQPNTYGYLEAMGALGNAQRTGKSVSYTHLYSRLASSIIPADNNITVEIYSKGFQTFKI